MKISYAVTVCNELEEIKQLLPNLLKNKKFVDEIIILFDEDNGSREVLDYLLPFNIKPNVQTWRKIGWNGHFADWKNQFLECCTGEWIVQIDADELPSDGFWDYINPILKSNRGLADTMYIGRRNTVDGLTQEHIQKWGWQVTERDGDQLVNYPDYQHRIFRNNGKIKWVNKVHEKLDGYGTFSLIPADEVFLWHRKDIKRQEKQNALYESL
jgi:uncharacterized C2H2 Zn-finger protein